MGDHRRVTLSYDADLQGALIGDMEIGSGNFRGPIKKRGRDEDDIVDDSGALASPRAPPGSGGDGSRGGYNRGRGGGGSRGPKRPSNMIELEEPPLPEAVQMAKQLLTRLGDYSVMTAEDLDVVGNIKALANVMVTVGDIANENADSIADLTLQCLTKLSMQVPILSTLIAVIYKENESFPRLVLDKLALALVSSLGEDDVYTAKLTLRALACLCACGTLAVDESGGFAETMNSLITIVEQNLSATDFKCTSASEVALYLVATTLPWCAESFSKSAQGQLILSRAVTLCERACHERRSPYAVSSNQAIFHTFEARTIEVDGVERETIPLTTLPTNYKDVCIDTLWEACSLCSSVCSGSPLPSCMVTPWNKLKDELSASQNHDGATTMSLDEGTANAVFLMYTQGRIGRKDRYCLPNGCILGNASSALLKPRFAILDDNTHSNVAQLMSCLTSFDRIVAVGYYQDIMHFFKPFLRDNGTVVGSIDLLIKHMMAVCKVFPAGLCLDYILVEFLFQQTLSNVGNPLHTSYICRILLDLCNNKEYPAIAHSVALCCHELFQAMSGMDHSSIRELSTWLAFHLSNSIHTSVWPYWEDWWRDVVEGGPSDPRAMFLQCVFTKCGRVDIPERMKLSLPEYLHPLIPPTSHPNCSLISDEKNRHHKNGRKALIEVCDKLVSMIGGRDKEPADVVQEWLESLDIAVESDPPSICDSHWRVTVLLQCIFYVGRVTLTNITALLERYSDAIREFSEGNEGQRAICECLWDIWGGDQAMLNIVLDLMLRRSLIQVGALGAFLCSPALLANVSTHPQLFSHIVIAAERGLDFVRAAVALRRDLGDAPPTSSTNKAITSDTSDTIVDSSEDVIGSVANAYRDDNEDGDGRSSWRSTTELGSSNSLIASSSSISDAAAHSSNTFADVEMDEEDDPLQNAIEAMDIALSNAQLFYDNIVGSLFVGIAEKASNGVNIKTGEGDEDALSWSVAALSLIKRIDRAYCGCEAFLSMEPPAPIIVNVDSILQRVSDLPETDVYAEWKRGRGL